MEVKLQLSRLVVAPEDEGDEWDETQDEVELALADALAPAIDELLDFAAHQDVFVYVGDLTLTLDKDRGKLLLLTLRAEARVDVNPPVIHQISFAVDAVTRLEKFSAALARRSGTVSLPLARKPLKFEGFRPGQRRAISVSWDLERSPDLMITFPFEFPFEDGYFEECVFYVGYHDFIDVMEMLVRRRGRMARAI